MRIQLAPLFGEGMVLQRDAAARLWGRASPFVPFELAFQDRRTRVQAGADGRWLAEFEGLAPGGPYMLLCNGEVLVQDVWVGDVWLCLGQSNMERTLAAGASWPTDALRWKGDAAIRQLCLPTAVDFERPREDVPGAGWIGADTDRVTDFSGVGFHLARELRQRTGVPQGLVLAAVGGSTAQAWLSEEALKAFPRHHGRLRALKGPRLTALQAAETERREAWHRELAAADPSRPERLPETGWTARTLPGSWDLPGAGSAWFRRRFTLEAPRGEARLRLGTLIESDEVWINGIPVGATAYQYPLRRYGVPEGVLRAGENELLMRVVVPRGGGLFTPGKPFSLEGDGFSLDLAGEWQFLPGAKKDELPADTFLPMEPLGVHNAMLAPLVPLGVRGVLWYQGESNVHEPADYGDLMRALITEVRWLWRQELPFLVVQLPRFGAPRSGAAPDGWAEVQEQQRRLRDVPGVGLTVIRDQGEWNDIHPGEKKEVGYRLAQTALRLVYGEKTSRACGPLPVGVSQAGDGLLVVFDQDVRTDGASPGGFCVAGDDGVFHPAEAEARGREVFVRRSGTKAVWLRYAWASNPEGANLVNDLGWPASAFRTDKGDYA